MKHKQHYHKIISKVKIPTVSKVLIVLSVALLCGTVYLVARYGGTVYYLTFHKPFKFELANVSSAQAPALPVFTVTSEHTLPAAAENDVQHVTVTVTSNQTVPAYLKIWIRAADRKEVYKSPLSEGHPEHFVAGKPQTFSFDYKVPSGAPKGIYYISDSISSANMQTDYYVNERFASFKVL